LYCCFLISYSRTLVLSRCIFCASIHPAPGFAMTIKVYAFLLK